MAQTTIGSTDLTLLRSGHHTIDDIRLNIFRAVTVTSVTVDDTPTSNPASEITVTGDVSSTEVGQRFKITSPTGDLRVYGTLRLATSGQTLKTSPISLGDSGYVSAIQTAITSGDTVTVYKDRPLWGDYSRIVSNTFRKKWDVSYSDENEDSPPIANTGAAQSARVDVGNSASFTLPRSGANDSFAFGSKTISTYLWTLPTGVTLQGGFATSDAVIGVDAVAGQHILSLTVTDSNSKTHTSYIYLFVSDGSTYQDLFEEFTATIQSDSQTVDGRTITFTIRGSNIESDILPASFVHLQHDSLYDGSSLSVGVDVDIFTGYITDYQYSHDGEYGQATVTAISPYLYTKQVFMPPQIITEVSNPDNWAEVDSTLSNPRGALCYNRWQSQNMFAMHDIDAGDITTPRKLSYIYNGNSVSSGLDVASEAIAGNVGCSSDGTIVLRHNPVHEDNTFRNALAVGMTFDEFDIIPPLTRPSTIPTPYNSIRAGAFAFDGGDINNVKAWYGVKRWAQGASETVLPDFSVTESDGLDGVLEKVGHISANLQYPDTQPLKFLANLNVIDPAYMIWYRLDIDSEFDPAGDGYDDIRVLPQRVNRTWDNTEQTITIDADVKLETFGQPADEWVLGSGTTVVSGGWVSDLGVPYTPVNEDFSILSSIALAWNTAGDLGITQTFTNDAPIWTSINPYVTGTVCDACYDYNSDFFTGGYVISDPLSVYIASISGSTLYIYRLFDIQSAQLQVDLLTTYTMNDSSTTTEARIQSSTSTGTLAVVAWHDQTGVLFGRTTDGGSTWSSATQVGSAITDTDNDNVSIGLYISGVNQVITAPNSSSEYGTYLATTAGGSFSKLSNSEDNTAPNPMITGDDNTTLYVATDNNGSGAGAAFDTTFDVGGWGNYTITPTGFNSSGDTATGNPGNAGYGERSTSTPSFSGNLGIEIDLLTDQTVTKVEADWYHNCDDMTLGKTGSDTYTLRMSHDMENSGGSPIYIMSPTVQLDTGSASGLGNPYTGFSFAQSWETFSHTPASAVANVRSINLTFGTLATNSANIQTPSPAIQQRLDNIKVYTSGGAVIDPILYKVTTYTATDTWTDVSPDTDYIPKLPYGLGLDLADANNLEFAGTNDTTDKYYQSANAGSSWSDNGASDNRIIKRINDVLIIGGNDVLDLSVDTGTTLIDKRGNLATTWGSVGVIKGILVLI